MLEVGLSGFNDENILKVATGIELYPFLEVKKIEQPPNKISLVVEEMGKFVIEFFNDKFGMEFPEVYQCNLCGKTVRCSRCSKCMYARYCNSECQRKNWREHKPACQTISAFKEIYKAVTI